jgi:hypothetical protein
MGTSLLWIAGIALESVILFRFLKNRLYAHYPFFFAYLVVVWAWEMALWPIYRFHYASYSQFFWVDQFLNLLAGFGVLFEIVRKSFQSFPGARTFAATLLAAMLAVLCGYFVFRLVPSSVPGYEGFSDLERDFRAIQALTLCGVLVVISYYRIDVGRNLFGIIAGLGLYVGSTILSHELKSYVGPGFNAAWGVVQPYAYLLSLIIWVFTLWSCSPAAAPEMPPEIDDGYEAFARQTQHTLGTMKAAVSKADRP